MHQRLLTNQLVPMDGNGYLDAQSKDIRYDLSLLATAVRPFVHIKGSICCGVACGLSNEAVLKDKEPMA